MMRNSIAVLGCGDKEEEAMKRIYHLRSQLMPYIYSSVHQCYEDMIPLNRGLYLEYPSDEKAYQCRVNSYSAIYCWERRLPCREKENRSWSRKRYGCRVGKTGTISSRESISRGRTVTVESPLDEFPLFVKGATHYLCNLIQNVCVRLRLPS